MTNEERIELIDARIRGIEALINPSEWHAARAIRIGFPDFNMDRLRGEIGRLKQAREDVLSR